MRGAARDSRTRDEGCGKTRPADRATVPGVNLVTPAAHPSSTPAGLGSFNTPLAAPHAHALPHHAFSSRAFRNSAAATPTGGSGAAPAPSAPADAATQGTPFVSEHAATHATTAGASAPGHVAAAPQVEAGGIAAPGPLLQRLSGRPPRAPGGVGGGEGLLGHEGERALIPLRSRSRGRQAAMAQAQAGDCTQIVCSGTASCRGAC